MTTIQGTILRFQNEDGDGLYSCFPYPQSFFPQNIQYDTHPSPYRDSLFTKNAPNDSWCPDFIFGFATLGQLRAWLYSDGFLMQCYRHGKFCYEFVGEIILGHTQAAIRASSKKMIRQLSLEDLGVDKLLIKY